jgi:hypothetical protein
MKQVKNIVAVSVVALSMAFAGGLSVSTNVNWTDIDADAIGTTGNTVLFSFNDQTSLGIDSQYGMLAVFNVVAGANLRLGWSTGHTIGLGYTFWSSGGEGVQTSLSTSVNFTKTAGGADDTSLSMALGFSL